MPKPHHRPIRGATDDWLTPPWFLKLLGAPRAFALDPCCPARMPWRTAERMVHADREDGLALPWNGRVFLNPPYGPAIRHWLEKLAAHGNGIALVPARTEVESWFWPYVWEAATAVVFLRGRLCYHRPDGTKARDAGHGSVVAAYGRSSANLLRRAGLPGRFFEL